MYIPSHPLSKRGREFTWDKRSLKAPVTLQILHTMMSVIKSKCAVVLHWPRIGSHIGISRLNILLLRQFSELSLSCSHNNRTAINYKYHFKVKENIWRTLFRDVEELHSFTSFNEMQLDFYVKLKLTFIIFNAHAITDLLFWYDCGRLGLCLSNEY